MKTEALEKVLPKLAKDIGVMKIGITKLVAIQVGTPRSRAEQFFASQASKESSYEAKFGKTPTKTPQERTVSRKSGGLGFGPGTSVLDFIKNIANVLVKGALVGLGTYGLSKLFDSDEVRKTLKNFIKDIFFSILNVVQKSARMLNEVMTENAPQIREAVVNTFLAIKDLLVTSIKGIGDLLSDKRIWEGVWEIISTIFNSIKKVLSTEIEIQGVNVSLGTVLGAVIVAFGALKGAVFLLKAAAEAAAKSLFGVAGGGSDIPDAEKGDKKKKGPYRDPKTGRYTKTPPTPPVSLGNRLLGGGVVGTTVGVGAALSYGAAATLEGMSKDELDVLAQSGGGDETAMAAAILAESKKPTPAPKNKQTIEGKVTRAYTKSAPDEFDKSLLNTIAKGESGGDYNSMNQGGTKDRGIYGSGNSKGVIGKNLTDMTVGEVLMRGATPSDSPEKRKKEGLIFAAGRYQIVPDTLKSLVNAGVVSRGDRFDAATQDKLGKALLEDAGLASFKEGKMSASQFQNNVSKVWGAIGNTSGQSSLGGPNKANLAATSQFTNLLAGGKEVVEASSGAPTQMASTNQATPLSYYPTKTASASSVTPEKSTMSDSIASLAHEQFLALDKLMGGKLMEGSTVLADMLRDITKEFMNNPTFVDNSQIVNNSTQSQSGPIASVNNPDATSLLIGASSSYYTNRG